MIDLIQVQDDLFGILMSLPGLATVNIVEERRFRLNSTVAVDAIWQTVRNNCSGDGLLIEIPGMICDSDGVTGPPLQLELSFVSFQNGDAAFLPASPGCPAGGGLYAEQIEQILVDALHLLNIGGLGTLRVSGRFSSPARDYAGVNARRTKVLVTPKQTSQTGRAGSVSISVSGDSCTLASANSNAAIYYTVDGSFPSNGAVAQLPLTGQPVNPASTLYIQPFTVQPGQLIRAVGYVPGYNLGPVTKYQN